MTILLFILKAIGILLLAVCLLVLFLLGLLLLCPIRYSAEGNIREKSTSNTPTADNSNDSQTEQGKLPFRIQGGIQWMLRIVSVNIVYDGENIDYAIKIFGKKLKVGKKEGSNEEIQEDAEELSDLTEDIFDEEEETQSPEENADESQTGLTSAEENNADDSQLLEQDTADMTNTEKAEGSNPDKKTESSEQKIADMAEDQKNKESNTQADSNAKNQEYHSQTEYKSGISYRIEQLILQIKSAMENISDSIANIKQKISEIRDIVTDEVNKNVVSYVWKELLSLLKHFRFRRIKTDLVFAAGDPARTGQALGVLAMIPSVYQYEISVCPDFESDHIYVHGSFLIKGHIRLVHIVLSTIRLLIKKEVRLLIK